MEENIYQKKGYKNRKDYLDMYPIGRIKNF